MDFFKKKETPKEAANRAKRETKREVRVSSSTTGLFVDRWTDDWNAMMAMMQV
jgi:hypothetical protein